MLSETIVASVLREHVFCMVRIPVRKSNKGFPINSHTSRDLSNVYCPARTDKFTMFFNNLFYREQGSAVYTYKKRRKGEKKMVKSCNRSVFNLIQF